MHLRGKAGARAGRCAGGGAVWLLACPLREAQARRAVQEKEGEALQHHRGPDETVRRRDGGSAKFEREQWRCASASGGEGMR